MPVARLIFVANSFRVSANRTLDSKNSATRLLLLGRFIESPDTEARLATQKLSPLA